MAYDKQTWQTGDTVTSAKLNHMEDGIANAGALVCNVDVQTMTLDKTWQEISDSALAIVVLSGSENEMARGMVTETLVENGRYIVNVSADMQLVATSADGYPVVSE